MAESRPEGTDGHLTNRQIVLLGSAISAKNMRAVALGYMDIDKEVLRNIADENKDDPEGFTRDVIEKWKNKPQNSGPEQVKKLASLLFEAADEGSYVDPDKIRKILNVSREDLLERWIDGEVSEKELNDLVDILRPITEERTKIDLIPWVQNHTVKLEDLYTELTVDKLENQPTGLQKNAPVKDYKELFTQGLVGSGHRVKGIRVLGKGDPGSGKTTFLKKVVWDWARGIFKEFSLVFFVSLKLVSPGDSIENIIIRQTPELVGLKVTVQKLRDILETFGSRCLIILDGYDEHISGGNKPNEDIIKLLRGENFLYCNVLLTSRPHSVAEIEHNFSTTVSIQGFTEKHAREFASRVVLEKDKIDKIMEIQCLNAGKFIKEGSSVFTCPILLLFVCVLANSKEIDLARKEVTLGEIYMRLVRCLYRKYTVHKGIAFKQSEFVKVVLGVGVMALKTMFFVRMGLQRSEVIRIAGEDAFDYGLFTGHEDFRLSAQETADIIISFPHRTIQEFLGALSLVLIRDCLISLRGILGDLQGALFNNPLFLHFFLWFLGNDCTEEYFLLKNKEEMYREIVALTVDEINFTHFNSILFVRLCSGLSLDSVQRDEIVEQFVQKMFSKCKKIKHLELHEGDPVGQIMSTFRPILSQLSSIQLPSLLTDELCSGKLHIVIGDVALSQVDKLIRHCERLDKPLAVHFILTESKDLSKYLTVNISSLHIVGSKYMNNCLSGLHSIPYSPHLTHLHLYNQILNENFTLALSNGVEKGNLPNLRILCLERCVTTGKLHLLFQSEWPTLTYLDLCDNFLIESDIHLLRNIKLLLPNLTSLVLFLGDKLADDNMTAVTEVLLKISHKARVRSQRHIALLEYETPLPNITELWLSSVNKHEYKKLVAALNKGVLPQLRELGIEMWEHVDKNKMVDIVLGQLDEYGEQWDIIEQGDTLDWLPPVNAPTLTELTLHSFICTMYHLDMVTQSTVLTKLHKLDISHSSGMTGTLSILLCHSFPSLNSLILSDCGLNSQDLCSLAQARGKGRLPELRHLDISKNVCTKVNLKDLFSCDAHWENLCSLNTSNDSSGSPLRKGYWCCIHNVPPSNELVISENSINFLFQPGDRCWTNVHKLKCTSEEEYRLNVLCEILDALERGLLPALNLVKVEQPEHQSFESMLRPSLVNLLSNNAIEGVFQLIAKFFKQFHVAIDDNFKKFVSGEGGDSIETTIEMALKTFDMSSILALVEDEGLTESQTKEIIEAVRMCLIRKAKGPKMLYKYKVLKILTYGVYYDYG